MSRCIVLDTETTGLDPRQGHRIIEIGCVELAHRQATGRHFHQYLNPEREVDEGAAAVHGMRWADLIDKPRFAAIVDELLDFVADAEIIIHNAPFDCGFLDAELERLGRPVFKSHCSAIIDSLAHARELHPGKRNSLDVLCDRYEISNAHRTLHGALLDAQLLAEVWLAMTRGQESLVMELTPAAAAVDAATRTVIDVSRIPLQRATADDLAAHAAYLDALEAECKAPSIWRRTGLDSSLSA